MVKELKIDITNKIVATFRNDYLELKANQLFVGKIQLGSTLEDVSINLEDGYVYENGKVFKCISLRENKELNEEKVLNEGRK